MRARSVDKSNPALWSTRPSMPSPHKPRTRFGTRHLALSRLTVCLPSTLQLKLSKADVQKLRLFILKDTAAAASGTELPRNAGSLSQFLSNDCVVSVSVGEDFIR